MAYLHVGPTTQTLDDFHNLDMWENTRPVRGRMDNHQLLLLKTSLLDVGITATLVEDIKLDLAETHIAVLNPEAGPNNRANPYDFLFFLKFGSQTSRVLLVQRLLPYFDRAGTEAGVDFHIRPARGVGTSPLSLTMFDGFVVLCWGSDSALRQILRNREAGPSRTLNDVDAFRSAWRESGRDADAWAYVRKDHLVDVGVRRILAPRLGEKQRAELAKAVALLPDSAVEGVAFAANLQTGTDAGEVGLYPGVSDAFEELSDQTGLGTKGLLSAIPADSVLAAVATVEQPEVVLAEWHQPLMRLLSAIGAPVPGSNPEITLNELQAQSGVNLKRDVWKNVARELAVALVPKRTSSGLSELRWLLVVQVYSPRRAHTALSTLARKAYQDTQGGPRGRSTRYSFRDDELASVSRLSDWGDGSEPSQQEVLCWTTMGSNVIIGPDCDVVRMSLDAETEDSGLDQLSAASDALGRLPRRTTVTVLAHLRSLLAHLGGPLPVTELLSDDFVAAAAMSVYADRITISANVSALTLGFLWASAALEVERQRGRADVCRKLTETVCSGLTDDACREWKRTIGEPPPDVCETGLRTMLSLDARLQ